jgi:hypothetical protein
MRGEEEGDSLLKAPFFRTRPADGHKFRFMAFLSSSVAQ